MPTTNTTPSIIPQPSVVRDLLTDALCQVRLLRSLLRLSERAEREQRSPKDHRTLAEVSTKGGGK